MAVSTMQESWNRKLDNSVEKCDVERGGVLSPSSRDMKPQKSSIGYLAKAYPFRDPQASSKPGQPKRGRGSKATPTPPLYTLFKLQYIH